MRRGAGISTNTKRGPRRAPSKVLPVGVRKKLTSTSHELRNCIAALIMTLASVADGADVRSARTLALLKRCTRRLMAVSDVLDDVVGPPAPSDGATPRGRSRPRHLALR